jgi:hypothetical protein
MATAVVGRIVYIVDNSTNATRTSTSYSAQVTFRASGTLVTSAVSDIVANGSQILTREDVNAAGTVTVRAMNGEIMCVPTRSSASGLFTNSFVVRTLRHITGYPRVIASKAHYCILPTDLRAV